MGWHPTLALPSTGRPAQPTETAGHPICWYSSPWLHAVLVFFLGILVSACGKNASITDGSYMGLTIGSDKAKAFERVEELARSGRFQGARGIEKENETALTLADDDSSFARLLFHQGWGLIEPGDSSRRVVVSFEGGNITRLFEARDQKLLTSYLPTDSRARSLKVGMPPVKALELARAYLAEGSVSRIEVVAEDTGQGPQWKSFEAMRIWDCWILRNEEWEALRLDFENDRLARIQHRRLGGVYGFFRPRGKG